MQNIFYMRVIHAGEEIGNRNLRSGSVFIGDRLPMHYFPLYKGRFRGIKKKDGIAAPRSQ